MIRAEGTVEIERAPREVLEFVLDLDRYREADAKITRVDAQPTLGEGQHTGRAHYRGRLRGIPTPSQWQILSLDPWRRLDLTTEPGQWTARMATFEGGFICEERYEGTTWLTHFEQFDFRPPAKWILEPYLNKWMQRYLVDIELPRLKALIEAA